MSDMDMYRQMHPGELYAPGDSDPLVRQFPCMALMHEQDHTRPSGFARQQARAAWSRAPYPPAWWRWATPAACSGR